MKTITFFTFACFLFLALPLAVTAEQTDNCHCFRNRDYDPVKKFAADDYLLTTTFNSLIASTLKVSKKEIVMMKMKGGVDPDTLLVALYIASRTNAPVDILLGIHENGGSWQDILKSPARQQQVAQDPVLGKIAAGAADSDITCLVTDAMISQYYQTPAEEIGKMREQKFTNKEIGLLFALEKQSAKPVADIIKLSRQKKMSWSEIAHLFNRTPSEVGKGILNQ